MEITAWVRDPVLRSLSLFVSLPHAIEGFELSNARFHILSTMLCESLIELRNTLT